ncbi:MAG: hypothetical protein H6667_20405 [Ardenticatenaceae bacterium]|nr:hypothetical protein [Ardenticatenaceae bacterium]
MNRFLDWLGDFLEKRRGLLPLIGLGLIVLNLILQIVPGPGSGWIVDSNLFLHLGLIVSLIGILLIRVL